MFTGITILVAVMVLWFVAVRLFKARRVSRQKNLELLALSSFMAGLGILCYGVRTLFIDVGRLDYYIYRVGITVHLGLGFIPAAIFVYENYLPGKAWLRRAFEAATVAGALLFTYGTMIPPLKRIEKMAPFEPMPFRLTNYPWQNPFWNQVFIWFCILVSLCVIWLVFVHGRGFSPQSGQPAGPSRRRLSALLVLLSAAVLAMPFAAAQPWFKDWQYVFFVSCLLVSIVLLFVSHDLIARRSSIAPDMHFALGIAYLLFPAMLCIFITPVFARILYLFGAAYLFLGLKYALTAPPPAVLDKA
jgi:hypothetical protein